MTPEAIAALLKDAAVVAARAHCPYSHYHVGAALLDAHGNVFLGCNVENASFGLTNCAERTALFRAVADGQREFTAIAIVAEGPAIPFPCGACRQVLTEFCRPELPVYIAVRDHLDVYRHLTLGELLPHGFTLY